MSPGPQIQIAQAVIAAGLCSGRAACRILPLARTTFWYQAGQHSDRQGQLVAWRHALAAARYAYRRIMALLQQEGWWVGKRQVQRLRRAEGLRVPPPKRKLVRQGHSTGLPTRAMHRGYIWTGGFIADAIEPGRARRRLTILDEYSRECDILRTDRALRAAEVLHWLQRAITERGAPAYLRSDNRLEFIAKEVQYWLATSQIKTISIDPPSLWQNGFLESFHGSFRDECLDREQLGTLTEARVIIEGVRRDYNQRRPYSQLGYVSPARFASQLLPSPAPVGLRPPSAADGQTYISPPTSIHLPGSH